MLKQNSFRLCLQEHSFFQAPGQVHVAGATFPTPTH